VGNACLENVHAQTIAEDERACVFVIFGILFASLCRSSTARVPSIAVVVVDQDAVGQAGRHPGLMACGLGMRFYMQTHGQVVYCPR